MPQVKRRLQRHKVIGYMFVFIGVFALVGAALFGVSNAQGFKKKVTVTGQLNQHVECVQAPCEPVPLTASLNGTMVKKRSWFMGSSRKWHFTTDEQGKFELTLPKGTYTVQLPRKASKKDQTPATPSPYTCDAQTFKVKKTAIDLPILCYANPADPNNPTAPAPIPITPVNPGEAITVDSGKQFRLNTGQTAALADGSITLKLRGVGGNTCQALSINDPNAVCTEEYSPVVLFDLTVNGQTYSSTGLGKLPPEAAGYVKAFPTNERKLRNTTDLKTYASFTLYATPQNN